MGEFAENLRRSIERAREEAERAQEWVEDTTAPVREPIKETLEEIYHDIGLPAPWEVPEVVDEKVDELRDWLLEELGLDDEVQELDDVLEEIQKEIEEKIEEETEQEEEEEEEEEENEDDDDGWDLPDWLGFGWLVGEFLGWLDSDHDLFSWDIDDFTILEWEPDPPEDEEEQVIEVRRFFFFAPVPFAARILDPMAHGGVAAPGPGSPNVLIGGLPALRMIDQVACPMQLPIPHTPSVFVPSPSQVLINGMPALRAGDFVVEGLGGPNPIVMGCATVIIGQPVPPVECYEFEQKTIVKKNRDWWRWKKVELGNVKNGKVTVGFNLEGPYVRVEADIELAHAYAETTPEFSEDVKIDAEAILGKGHLEVEISESWTDIAMRRISPEISHEITDKKLIEIPPPEVDFDLPWE